MRSAPGCALRARGRVKRVTTPGLAALMRQARALGRRRHRAGAAPEGDCDLRGGRSLRGDTRTQAVLTLAHVHARWRDEGACGPGTGRRHRRYPRCHGRVSGHQFHQRSSRLIGQWDFVKLSEDSIESLARLALNLASNGVRESLLRSPRELRSTVVLVLEHRLQ